jgi:DNA-binding MarR family transcriptional regulator
MATSTSSTIDIAPMDLESHLFFLCTQVVYRRTRAMHEALAPLGLLATEYRVLSAVLRQGPLAISELAHWTAYERTRLTHMLDGMEKKKWVTRTSADGDRRSIVVTITTPGRRIFAKAKVIVDELTDVITSANTPAELEAIRKGLTTMRDRLIAMGL